MDESSDYLESHRSHIAEDITAGNEVESDNEEIIGYLSDKILEIQKVIKLQSEEHNIIKEIKDNSSFDFKSILNDLVEVSDITGM